MDSWMKTNPGKRFSIYDVPSITTNAIVNSATPKNITNGFLVAGIWPFNRNAFTEDEYAPAIVTDIVLNCESNNNEIPSPSSINIEIPVIETLETQAISLVTPENVRLYPKAKLNLKITQKGGRRKGKATILTETPEKNEIAQRAAEKNKNIKRKLFPTEAKKRKGSKNATKQKKCKNTTSFDEEEDDTFCMICTELYSNSKSGEAWIQCCRCKFWSHEACAKIMFTAYYTCDNCEADDEQ